MNGLRIFDTKEEEMAYLAKQQEEGQRSAQDQSKYMHRPPTNENHQPIEHMVEPARMGGEEGGKTCWVIRNFLAEGSCVFLAAEAGSGKSTLIYSAAEAIQEGNDFLGQLPVKRGKVLVIQGDEPPRDAQSKFRRMELNASFDITYLDEFLNLEWFRRQLQSKRYLAVFIDSATSVLATNNLEVTDLAFSRKLYEMGRISAESGVAVMITGHLNKPSENHIRKVVTKHDISGVATINAAVSDIWGMLRDPNPCWDAQFNLVCLGKRNCKEGTIWQLEGSDEDYSWVLKEIGDGGLLPKARILLEEKIIEHFRLHLQPLSLKEIASQLDTEYEYTRRCCTELFDEGRLNRQTEKNGKQGRPSYLYGPA